VDHTRRILGAPDGEAGARRLFQGDACLGRAYRASDEACKRCTLPIIEDERVRLLREVCAEMCQHRLRTSRLAKNLSSEGVRRLLAAGKPPQAIVAEMAGEDASWEVVLLARHTLARRLAFLRKQAIAVPPFRP